VLKANVAEREMGLAKAALDMEQARERWQQETEAAFVQAWQAHEEKSRERWQQETQTALAKAEQAWQASDAARAAAVLAKAEQTWQANEAPRVAAALAKAEQTWQSNEAPRVAAALAKAERTWQANEAAHVSAALAKAERTWQANEAARLESALAKAEQTWQTNEAARVTAAMEEGRKQSSTAVAEATARCEAAEAVIAQLKEAHTAQAQEVQAQAAQQAQAREAAAAVAKPLSREPMLARSPAFEGEVRTERGKIVLHKNRITEAAEQPPTKSHLVRDIFVVAALAVLAISAYSNIGTLSQSLQSNVTAVADKLGPDPGPAAKPVTPPPPPPPAPAPAVSKAAPQRIAVVVSDVKVHANPQSDGAAVTALRAGSKVTMLERRGNWVSVQIEGDGPNAKPVKGWIFGTFLKDEAGNTPTAQPAKSK